MCFAKRAKERRFSFAREGAMHANAREKKSRPTEYRFVHLAIKDVFAIDRLTLIFINIERADAVRSCTSASVRSSVCLFFYFVIISFKTSQTVVVLCAWVTHCSSRKITHMCFGVIVYLEKIVARKIGIHMCVCVCVQLIMCSTWSDPWLVLFCLWQSNGTFQLCVCAQAIWKIVTNQSNNNIKKEPISVHVSWYVLPSCMRKTTLHVEFKIKELRELCISVTYIRSNFINLSRLCVECIRYMWACFCYFYRTFSVSHGKKNERTNERIKHCQSKNQSVFWKGFHLEHRRWNRPFSWTFLCIPFFTEKIVLQFVPLANIWFFLLLLLLIHCLSTKYMSTNANTRTLTYAYNLIVKPINLLCQTIRRS